MNLREQRYVLAIAKHRSIKEAAKELCIAPPTLSIFLGNLERELGIPLFDRLGKKFAPTCAGRVYIDYAQKMAQLDDEFEKEMMDLKNESKGLVRLGMHRRRTTYLVPATLAEFLRVHPDVDFQLHESDTEDLFKRLLAGELDLVINNHIHRDEILEYIPFYDDRLVVVTSADHPKIQGLSYGKGLPSWVDLSLFNGETFILQRPSQASRGYVDQAMAYSSAEPGRTLIISNMEAASQLAAEGIGIAFNMLSYTVSYNYPKPVRYFFVGDRDVKVPYYIIRRRDRYTPSYLDDLISILKSCINLCC